MTGRRVARRRRQTEWRVTMRAERKHGGVLGWEATTPTPFSRSSVKTPADAPAEAAAERLDREMEDNS